MTDILRAWAKALGHRSAGLLKRVFWKPTVWETRTGADGIQARDHYDALKLVREDLPGLVLLDGDTQAPSTQITGRGLQRIRWNRYEIESYLVHPEALKRFVKLKVGHETSQPHLEDLQRHFEETYPPTESPISELREDIRAAVSEAVQVRYPGVKMIAYMESGGTDGMHFRRAGIPT